MRGGREGVKENNAEVSAVFLEGGHLSFVFSFGARSSVRAEAK